jgi:hypothetical protein
MNDYLWVIGALLFLIAVWVLWSILKVYFQSKVLAQVEIKANRIAKRLAELSCGSNDPDSKIYKDLVQSVNLEELWARVRTRVKIGTKNSPRDAELVVKLHRLISEIESLMQNDLTSRTMAQIGDWDDAKIAFCRDSGIKQRASIAAIDQLVTDIKHELRV